MKKNEDRILEVAIALQNGYFDDPKTGQTIHLVTEDMSVVEILCKLSGIGEWVALDNGPEKVCLINGIAYFREFPKELIDYYGWDFRLTKIPEMLFTLWQQFLEMNPNFPREHTADWKMFVGVLESPLNLKREEIGHLIGAEIGLEQEDETLD